MRRQARGVGQRHGAQPQPPATAAAPLAVPMPQSTVFTYDSSGPALADQRFERGYRRCRDGPGAAVDRRRAEPEDVVSERGKVAREEPRAVFPLGAERDVAAPIARLAAAHTTGCGALPAGSLALAHRPRALAPRAAVTGVRRRAAWADEYIDSTACGRNAREYGVHQAATRDSRGQDEACTPACRHATSTSRRAGE